MFDILVFAVGLLLVVDFEYDVHTHCSLCSDISVENNNNN